MREPAKPAAFGPGFAGLTFAHITTLIVFAPGPGGKGEFVPIPFFPLRFVLIRATLALLPDENHSGADDGFPIA
jgi:hypothetical protein